MVEQVICPLCRRFGSVKTGGYCRACHKRTNSDEKHVLDDFNEVVGINREFFSHGDYGYMRDKFGYER